MTIPRTCLWSMAAVLAGCGEQLNVVNLNEPDVARAYASPALVEGVVAGLAVQLNNTQRDNLALNTSSRMLAGELTGTVVNFSIALHSAIPRLPVLNDIVNPGNNVEFSAFQRLGRMAATAIAAIDGYLKNGLTMGSSAQDVRARAFAYLILGKTLGYLSIVHDSAAILTPLVAGDEVPPLSGYKAVNTVALAMLDSAIAYANSAVASDGANGFPLPSTWISGRSDLTQANFVRLVRSYKARIRAGVARTPAERAAVDWNAVISDATNGIVTDHLLQVGGTTGWTAGFDATYAMSWAWSPMFYFGMADASGAYDAWIRTPLENRQAFLVVTPDRRWPQGTTRAAQQAEAPTLAVPPGRYMRNRPSASDNPGLKWGDSYYGNSRWGALNRASGSGLYADMTKAEMDLLAAEGYIRLGNLASAAALIDVSRVRNGLSSVGIPTSATVPLSTASSCVPRVPQGPDFTSTACGSLWEAMKYEKRMETSLTGFMVWFTDNRGWGDLVTGTVLEWPVPFTEMEARGAASRARAATWVAGRGTYGF